MKIVSLARISIGFSLFTVIIIHHYHISKFSDTRISLSFNADLTAHKNQGYIIGWDFREGQTCASRNLLGLLHWASIINSTVVEPCVHDSFFNMFNCFNATSNKADLLYFRDYFDLDYWNEQVLSHHFGRPMKAWKDFITDVPREAIIVYLWKDRGTRQPITFVNEGNITKHAAGCYNYSLKSRPAFTKILLNKFGSKIVREVCLKFDPFKVMDVKWFNKQILGDHKPSNAMILFTYWPGSSLGNIYFSNKALRHHIAIDYLKPSSRAIADSRRYNEKFLGNSYTAVALRIAKIATILREKKVPTAKIIPYLAKDCLHEVSSVLEKIDGDRMLALDLGRFGDGNAFDVTNDTVNEVVPKLVNIVYGNKWNWSEWENSFVEATGGITDSGYIAMLQKTLVTNATCIITGGPASHFQMSLIKEYKKRVKHPCIYQVCRRYAQLVN